MNKSEFVRANLKKPTLEILRMARKQGVNGLSSNLVSVVKSNEKNGMKRNPAEPPPDEGAPITTHEHELYDLFLSVGLDRTHEILDYYERRIQEAFPLINLDPLESKLTPIPRGIRNQGDHTLINHLIYLLGDQTLTFASICTRLSEYNWMPERKSSVSNVLSFRRDLFNHPCRGTHNLTRKALRKRSTLKL